MLINDLSIKLYQSISDGNEERVFTHWHASSMAECPRSHYFKRMGVPAINKPTAAKILRWQAGHIIEGIIRPHLLLIYPDMISNMRLTSKKLDLTGEFDNYSPKEKTLIEVKSVHVFAPDKIERSGEPYLNHEYQNHAYKLLMDEVEMAVEKIVYIYIALDGRILAIDTQIQSDILDNLKKRLEVLRKALETKTLPPCFCKPEHPLWKSTMQYCDYKSADECCSEDLIDDSRVTPDVIKAANVAFKGKK